jgi:hypothetical protein
MGELISLEAYKAAKRPVPAMQRLEAAVGRLEPLIRSGSAKLTPSMEHELEAIAKEVAFGYPRQAAVRAERLADLLEHPAFRRHGA